MTTINTGISNALLSPQAPRRQAVDTNNNRAEATSVAPQSVSRLNSESGSAQVFSPELLSPEPANKALSQYLAIQNTERREQVQQLFGLDIYA